MWVVGQADEDNDEAAGPCRALISYAHEPDNSAHGEMVRAFWEFLRSHGIDAHIDLTAAQRRQDWALWMADEIRDADVVLVIASSTYRERAEGHSDPEVGRGVQWEARLIRDAFYSNQYALNRFVPVVLPGQTTRGVPDFLAPHSSTVYEVTEFTVAGAEPLLRLLTGQPAEIEPSLGPVPRLPPRATGQRSTPTTDISGEPDLPVPTVLNEFSGTSTGPLIQAGTIDSVVVHQTTSGAVAPSLARGRDYLAAYLRDGRLFGHNHDLVGRTSELTWLIDQVNDPSVGVVVLPGHGGSGKSRLLLELDDRLAEAGISAWWLSPDTRFTATVLAEISAGPSVLVVEDAHRRGDSEELTRLAARRPDVTVVMSTRPEGLRVIEAATTRAGHDNESVRVATPLGALAQHDAEALGEAAAGRLDDHVRDLAKGAREFPLLITVGGHLLRHSDTTSWALKGDQRFRRQIVDRWQDDAIAQISGDADPASTLRVLACLAALTPYDDSVALRTALADFLGIQPDSLVALLDTLEATELAVRRGPWLRVVPDVLSTEFLRRQAFTDTGRPTSFLDRLTQALPDQVVTVLRNAGEMDLFLRFDDPGYRSPLVAVWEDVRAQIFVCGAVGRIRWMRALTGVALYQPEPVLRLAQALFADPAATETDEYGRTMDQGDVSRELGGLLRSVGYHLDYVAGVCRLLWQVGKDDNRDRNSTEDHPLRVLSDIAGYQPGKGVAFQNTILDTVTSLLDEGATAGAAGLSPLSLLVPLTAKDGTTARSNGNSLTLTPFRILPDSVQALCERTRDLALQYLVSEDLAKARDAVVVLEAFLRDPLGMAGREITKQERQVWQPEQAAILAALRTCVGGAQLHPAVALRVRRAVSWHARYGDTDLRPVAAGLWRDLTDSYELDLQSAVTGGGVLDDDLDVADDDFDERDRRQRARQERLVDTLCTLAPADLLAQLQLQAETLRTAGNSVNDLGPVLGLVCERDTATGVGLGELLVHSPQPGRSQWLTVVLAALAGTAPRQAVALATAALDSSVPEHAVAVATACANARWAWDTPALRAIVDRVLAHPAQSVRARAIAHLHFMKQTRPDEVMAVALDVNNADPGVAAAVAEVLTSSSPPGHIVAREEDADRLLAAWDLLPEFGSYPIPELLRRLSRTHPDQVAAFFLRRAAHARSGAKWIEVIPVPFQMEVPSTVDADRRAALRRIRDEEADRITSHDRVLIFSAMAGRFSDSTLAVLRELLTAHTENSVQRVIELLAGASPSFVLDHVPFVVDLVDAASSVSGVVADRVHAQLLEAPGSLISIASLSSGAADAQLGDRARQIADEMTGRRARMLYEDIASRAEARIKAEQQRQQILRDFGAEN